MKPVSLKYEAPETDGPDAMDYPYGARISLHGMTLDKIGMDKLPDVGSTVTVSGKCVVIAVRQDGMDRCVELQFTDLGVDGAKSTAEKLYPTAS